MKFKICFTIYLLLLVNLTMCTKPKKLIKDDDILLHEPVSALINEIFEIKYNQHAIITDTTRIVNDSFPKYSVYFDWINDDRCSPCVSCFGGFVFTKVHIMNLFTKECVSDTLYYPSCTEYYIEGYTTYGFFPIIIDSVELRMKRILPIKPLENKNYIEYNEFKVSLIIEKNK